MIAWQIILSIGFLIGFILRGILEIIFAKGRREE